MRNAPVTMEGAKAIALAIIILCGMSAATSLMEGHATAQPDIDQPTTAPPEGELLIRRNGFIYRDHERTQIIQTEQFVRIQWYQPDGNACVFYTTAGNFPGQLSRASFATEYTRAINYEDAHAGEQQLITLDDLQVIE